MGGNDSQFYIAHPTSGIQRADLTPAKRWLNPVINGCGFVLAAAAFAYGTFQIFDSADLTLAWQRSIATAEKRIAEVKAKDVKNKRPVAEINFYLEELFRFQSANSSEIATVRWETKKEFSSIWPFSQFILSTILAKALCYWSRSRGSFWFARPRNESKDRVYEDRWSDHNLFWNYEQKVEVAKRKGEVTFGLPNLGAALSPFILSSKLDSFYLKVGHRNFIDWREYLIHLQTELEFPRGLFDDKDDGAVGDWLKETYRRGTLLERTILATYLIENSVSEKEFRFIYEIFETGAEEDGDSVLVDSFFLLMEITRREEFRPLAHQIINQALAHKRNQVRKAALIFLEKASSYWWSDEVISHVVNFADESYEPDPEVRKLAFLTLARSNYWSQAKLEGAIFFYFDKNKKVKKFVIRFLRQKNHLSGTILRQFEFSTKDKASLLYEALVAGSKAK